MREVEASKRGDTLTQTVIMSVLRLDFSRTSYSVIRKEPNPANQLVLSSEPIRISVKYTRGPTCFQSTPMSSELTDSGIFARRRFIFSSYFHLSLVEKTKIPWHMPPVSAFLY